jgi:hypothetical protein
MVIGWARRPWGMLFAAMHSKDDIPTVLNNSATKHRIDVHYGRACGWADRLAALDACHAVEPCEAMIGRLRIRQAIGGLRRGNCQETKAI